MSKRLIFIIALVLIILVVLAAYNFGGGPGKNEVAIPPPAVSVETQARVEITKDGFIPGTLVVTKGTAVTFVNRDGRDHRVVSDPHPTHTNLAGFDSRNNIAAGGIYSFVFGREGTFGYHDHLNPSEFKGVIVVGQQK